MFLIISVKMDLHVIKQITRERKETDSSLNKSKFCSEKFISYLLIAVKPSLTNICLLNEKQCTSTHIDIMLCRILCTGRIQYRFRHPKLKSK